MRRSAPLRRTGFGKRGEPMKRSGAKAIPGFNLKAKGEDSCRNCGAPASELHHAVNRSLSREGRDDLRNGIALCHDCHMAFHAGQPLPRSVFTLEEWEFISTLIGPGWLARRYPRDLDERRSPHCVLVPPSTTGRTTSPGGAR